MGVCRRLGRLRPFPPFGARRVARVVSRKKGQLAIVADAIRPGELASLGVCRIVVIRRDWPRPIVPQTGVPSLTRILSSRSLVVLRSQSLRLTQRRPTVGRNKVAASDPEGLQALLAALGGLTDYGTVTVRGNGQITMPKSTRVALRLNEQGHWRVLGLPELGVALLVGEPDAPHEVLASLIRRGTAGVT